MPCPSTTTLVNVALPTTTILAPCSPPPLLPFLYILGRTCFPDLHLCISAVWQLVARCGPTSSSPLLPPAGLLDLRLCRSDESNLSIGINAICISYAAPMLIPYAVNQNLLGITTVYHFVVVTSLPLSFLLNLALSTPA